MGGVSETPPAERIDLARWTTLSDAVPIGLCLVSAAGHFVAVNAAYCALYGYARAELLGQSITLVVPPEDTAAAHAALAEVLRGEAYPADTLTQRPRRRRDGTPLWIEGGAARVVGPDGAPLALFTITDITAQKSAEATLQARTAQLAALQAIGTELTRELDVTRVLELILARAMGLLCAASGAVFLWDEAEQVLAPRAHAGLGDWYGDVRHPLGEGIVGAVARDRMGRIVNDYPTSPYVVKELQHRTGVQRAICEPLLYRDTLIGTLIVRDKTDGSLFTPADLDLLALFATQAAVAIENARLHAATTSRADQLATLNKLIQTLTALRNPAAMATTILEAAQVLIPGAAGHLWEDDGAGALRLLGSVSLQDPAGGAQLRFRQGEGIAGLAAATGEPVLCADLVQDPRFVNKTWARAEGLVSLICLPLRARDRVLGILAIFTRAAHVFAAEEVRLLQSFAAQAAIALENARLHTAAQAELAERTAAEAALRESQALFLAFTESTPDPIFVKDLQGCYLMVNAATCALLGQPREAVLGQDDRAVYPPEVADGIIARDQAVLAGGTPQTFEETLPTPQGPRTFLAVEGPLMDAAGACRGLFGIARDITARKQLETERLIRSKLESTGLLAGGIAHDFNNLLQVILGNLELLGVAPEPERPPLLAEATAAVDEARALTQQFLTFAQARTPRGGEVAIAPLLRAAAGLALRGSAVTATFRLSDGLWAVSGDADQLGLVVRNLLLNAKEALPAGGQLTLAAENVPGPPPGVRMTIADSGAGIPPDLLPRVFDPYFSTKQRGGQRGMGLGLTVARSIVEQHGGTLALASTVGVGTTVTLTLPAARPAPPPAARPARARLLVMDDEPGIRTLLARALGPLGYTVDVAAHGAEAVQLAAGALAAGTPYTLALLDLTVKGGPGGVAALQALRQLDPRLRAIAVSGSPGHPEIQDPAAHGFQGALCKPFTSGDLQAALEACGG